MKRKDTSKAKKTPTESPPPVVTKDDLDRAHDTAWAALHGGESADMNLRSAWHLARREAVKTNSADPLLKYQEYVKDLDVQLERIASILIEALTAPVVKHLYVTCGHDVISLWETYATYHEACLDGLVSVQLKIVLLDTALEYDR